MQKTPIAIACSDLHLSLLQPACRADKDWMEVQAQYLKQLKDLAEPPPPFNEISSETLPIICAGDIFDRWNAPPELINFALKHLPDEMYCIPGQHDLPNHQMEQMHRSGYGVLVEACKIKNLTLHDLLIPARRDDLVLYPFEWGRDITPLTDQPKQLSKKLFIHVAVVHKYCWIPGCSYGHAPEASLAKNFSKPLKGYDVAIFGDNHCHFSGVTSNGTNFFNCGGFIRRKSDEIGHQPSVGVIYDDGTIKRHKLDTSMDKFHKNVKEREETALNMRDFIERLESLGEHGLNFRKAVEDHLRDEEIDPATKEIIRKALNEKTSKAG